MKISSFTVIDKTRVMSAEDFYSLQNQLMNGVSIIDGTSIIVRMSVFYTKEEIKKIYEDDDLIEWNVLDFGKLNQNELLHIHASREMKSDAEHKYSSEKIKIKLSQMVQCLHELKITNSSEPMFVYTCHRWNQSPFLIVWIIFYIFLVLYTVVPMVMAYLYIQNIRGNLKSCYIYNHSNLQYYGKLDQKEEFNIYKVACQLCLLLVTSAVLGGVI